MTTQIAAAPSTQTPTLSAYPRQRVKRGGSTASALADSTHHAGRVGSIFLFFLNFFSFFIACFEPKQATAKQAQEVPFRLLSPKQEQAQAVFF